MSKQQKTIREIWMVSREYGNIAGAGGVKDVVAGLSVTLARWTGRSVHVVLPCYGFIQPEKLGFVPMADPLQTYDQLTFETDLNYPEKERRERVAVWYTKIKKVNIYLLDAERFEEKLDVYTYSAKEERMQPWQKKGEGHFDYFAMNILLQKASLDLMMLIGARPDVIHCHDGHTAVLPAMLTELPGYRNYFRQTACVVTVHNAGKGYHQEVADLDFAAASSGLPLEFVRSSRLDDCFDPFLAGSKAAVLNTVSENYARELRETSDDLLTGWLGHTLLERNVKLEGVTNGIDPDLFSAKYPEKTGVAAAFDLLKDGKLTGKKRCKEALLQLVNSKKEIGTIRQSGYLTTDLSLPLITFVGRLSDQKGVAVLTRALASLLEKRNDFQFLLLGSGSARDESGLIALAKKSKNAGRVTILRGYDTHLATKIYAAGDFFVIPSRYEPCGLTDFMAQLFGNLPIVHHVGGLIKVQDGKTGFSYPKQSGVALVQAMERALDIYQKDPAAIRSMQQQAVELIEKHYTWKMVSKKYLDLYKKARKMK
jgi:starch synthase